MDPRSVTSARGSDPHVDHGNQRSHHGSPQPDEEKYPRTRSNDFQHHDCQRAPFQHAGDPIVKERYAGKHPQQQEAYARPTASERRE
jgi:hypothetical protein